MTVTEITCSVPSCTTPPLVVRDPRPAQQRLKAAAAGWTLGDTFDACPEHRPEKAP